MKQHLADLAKLGQEIPKLTKAATGSQPPPLAIAPFDEATAKRHQAAWAKHLGVPVEIANSIGMKLVLVPPGEFEMGSGEQEVTRLLEEAKLENVPGVYMLRVPTETPKHRVQIVRSFYLGIYEVTQEQYQRGMGRNPTATQGTTTRPVTHVNHSDAAEFCRKLSELPEERTANAVYRLPTEAEWEYACRAGTTTRYAFGDDEADLNHYAWWQANSQGQTQSVGQLQPNAWGLSDIHGNVWEWCHDWHGESYYSQFASTMAIDPQGPSEGAYRVIRGGSWSFTAKFCRSAYRGGYGPSIQNGAVGFRVVRSIAP